MSDKLFIPILAIALQGTIASAQLNLGASLVDIQNSYPGGKLELSNNGGYTYSVIDTSILTLCIYNIDASMNSRSALFIPANHDVYRIWKELLNESDAWKHSERKKWITRSEDGTIIQCEQIESPEKGLPDAFNFSVLK